LESSLQSEIVQRRREQSRVEALEKEAAELTARLGEKVAEEQRGREREAELEYRIRRLKDEATQSSAALAAQETELNRLKSTIDDLRVIESALCARVREITAQHEAASRRIQELQSETLGAAKTIESRDQELAGLRHAILDATRVGNNVSRERTEADCQVVEGWKRMLGTLLDTPLSGAQRGLVSEIASAMDWWRKGKANVTPGVEFQVEPLELHRAEFNCTEVVEEALAAVRKSAEEAGAKAQAALVGAVPERAYGSARHVHQLITMLAASLREIGRAENLEVEVSFEGQKSGDTEMLLSFVLSSANYGAENPCARLAGLVEKSAWREAVRCGGAELGLVSGWQLALAFGGRPAIETTGDGKARVRVELPLWGAP